MAKDDVPYCPQCEMTKEDGGSYCGVCDSLLAVLVGQLEIESTLFAIEYTLKQHLETGNKHKAMKKIRRCLRRVIRRNGWTPSWKVKK